MPGFVELVFILLILVAIFGVKWLPQIGASIGRMVHSVKQPPRSQDIDVEVISESKVDKPPENLSS